MDIKESKISFLWVILFIVLLGLLVVYINEGVIPSVNSIEKFLEKFSSKTTSTEKQEKNTKETVVIPKKDINLEKEIKSKENKESKTGVVVEQQACELNISLTGFSIKEQKFMNELLAQTFKMETGCTVIFITESKKSVAVQITNKDKSLRVLPTGELSKKCAKCLDAFSSYFVRDDVFGILKDRFGWGLVKD